MEYKEFSSGEMTAIFNDFCHITSQDKVAEEYFISFRNEVFKMLREKDLSKETRYKIFNGIKLIIDVMYDIIDEHNSSTMVYMRKDRDDLVYNLCDFVNSSDKVHILSYLLTNKYFITGAGYVPQIKF